MKIEPQTKNVLIGLGLVSLAYFIWMGTRKNEIQTVKTKEETKSSFDSSQLKRGRNSTNPNLRHKVGGCVQMYNSRGEGAGMGQSWSDGTVSGC